MSVYYLESMDGESSVSFEYEEQPNSQRFTQSSSEKTTAFTRAIQNMEEANRVKLEFLNSITQDFKAPLANLTDRTEYIKHQTSNKEIFPAIKDILDITNFIQRLVKDIESFAEFDLYGMETQFSHDVFFNSENLTDPINLESLSKLQLACTQYGLTKRESQCLYYLIRGMTAKQIGKQVGISNRTVEFYLENAKNKLNCNSRFELINVILESLTQEGS